MIAIINYNAGNIGSVKNALKRLNQDFILTDNPEEIKNAEKVIFPGVGEASSAMAYLKEQGLDQVIPNLTQPVLGICLGMQLLCKHSEEGDTTCLGVFDAEVKKFRGDLPVPHMGWNDFDSKKGPLLEGLNKTDNVYFVHSYYVEVIDETISETNYILNFSSGIQKNNFYAFQFHPEKSGEVGERIIQNFLAL